MLAEVDELERVGAARETGRHEVFVVGRESDARPRAAGTTHFVFMLDHRSEGKPRSWEHRGKHSLALVLIVRPASY
jgi:hypothetical protein